MRRERTKVTNERIESQMHLLDVAVKVSFLTKLSLTLFTHKYTLTRGHKKKGGKQWE